MVISTLSFGNNIPMGGDVSAVKEDPPNEHPEYSRFCLHHFENNNILYGIIWLYSPKSMNKGSTTNCG